MRYKHLLTAISLILISGGKIIAGPAPETGKYFLFLQGQHFGMESYQVTKDEDGKITVTSETDMAMLEGEVQNRLAFSSRQVINGQTLMPTYYEYRFKGGRNDGYEVTFDGRQITRKLITAGNVNSKTTAAEQDVLILDYNVYHHYQLLLDHYDQKKKGKQVFYIYVPLVGDIVEVSITANGEVPLRINQKTVPTLSYAVELPAEYGADVWATKEGRLVKVRLRRNSIEAIREEFVTVIKN